MSTETTNKRIKIDDGTTFGEVYTDRAIDELLKKRQYYKHSIQLSYNSDTYKATINLNYYSMRYDDQFTTIRDFYDALLTDEEKILCNGIITLDGQHLIATAVYKTTKLYTPFFRPAFMLDYINPSDGTEGHAAINDKFSVSDRVEIAY